MWSPRVRGQHRSVQHRAGGPGLPPGHCRFRGHCVGLPGASANGFGWRVWERGLGFRVQRLRLRVEDLGLQIEGVGFRI